MDVVPTFPPECSELHKDDPDEVQKFWWKRN